MVIDRFPARWPLAALLALSPLLLASPAAAQDDPGTPSKTPIQAKTEFFENYGRGKWKEAEEVFDNTIARFYPQMLTEKEVVFRYCEALFNQIKKNKGKTSKAAQALQKLVQREQDFPQALVMLAKIRAQSKKKEDRSDAEDLLLRAAKLGFPVLSEIQDKKNKDYFKELNQQPRFILRVMRSQNDVDISTRIYNPFQNPFTKDKDNNKEKAPIDLDSGPDRAKLEKEIDRLFSEIERLLEEQKLDGLIPVFKKLDALQAEYKKIGGREIRKKVKEWQERREGYRDAQMIVLLRTYIKEGNGILKQMSRSLDKEEYEQVFQGFRDITQLVDKMRAEENEQFRGNAQVLFDRAKSFNDNATKLKRIKEFKLDVTGIVLDPGIASSDRQSGDRCIINDRVYKEAEVVNDEQDEPIEGLTVIEINEGSVTFRYKDTNFTRELKPDPNAAKDQNQQPAKDRKDS